MEIKKIIDLRTGEECDIGGSSGVGVEANPTLTGNESTLNSIGINGTNYAVGGKLSAGEGINIENNIISLKTLVLKQVLVSEMDSLEPELGYVSLTYELEKNSLYIVEINVGETYTGTMYVDESHHGECQVDEFFTFHYFYTTDSWLVQKSDIPLDAIVTMKFYQQQVKEK